MSMRYNAVDEYGLVIDEETAKYIVKKLSEEDKELFNDCDSYQNVQFTLYDYGICDCISEFTGEANTLRDDGLISWNADEVIYYRSDPICFVQLRFPTLFKQAYKDMDEIVDELKYKVGKYLPEDFDYRNKICNICGVYYG